MMDNFPFLIAGPCSAESETQIWELAKVLKNSGKVNIFRAGIWKPRTKPGSFEGIGELGLSWLEAIQKTLDFPVATEVATVTQVEKALKHNIRIFWLGARTTVNPIYVQELADVFKGVQVQVWIKNPLHADLGLWEGAIERFLKNNIEIGAIHRGFHSYGEKKYRNAPEWSLPLTLREHYPELKLLCDISHIAGNRNLLPHLAQQALDFGFEGWMIETHDNPDQAWSDVAQQLTPMALFSLLEKIKLYQKSTNKDIFLEELREKIDFCDEQLRQILFTRMAIVKQIALHKKQHQLQILQFERWQLILEKYKKAFMNEGLSEEFAKKLVDLIHQESLVLQNQFLS